MSKMQQASKSIRAFTDDVLGEVHKTSWPSRQELVESTTVVIISLFMLALFTGVCDKVLSVLLRLLIHPA